jgi:hypothetical protein
MTRTAGEARLEESSNDSIQRVETVDVGAAYVDVPVKSSVRPAARAERDTFCRGFTTCASHECCRRRRGRWARWRDRRVRSPSRR